MHQDFSDVPAAHEPSRAETQLTFADFQAPLPGTALAAEAVAVGAEAVALPAEVALVADAALPADATLVVPDVAAEPRVTVWKRLGREIVAAVQTLISAAVYATLIVTFGFQVARVDGLSMAPTLEDHD